MEQGTSRVKRLEKLRQMLEPFLFLFWCVAFDTRWQHVTCYFDVLLNVNIRYIWFYAVVNGLNILVCFLVWNDNSNKRAENWAKIDLRMLLWAEKMAQILKGKIRFMPLQLREIGCHVENHATQWHDFQHEIQLWEIGVAWIKMTLYRVCLDRDAVLPMTCNDHRTPHDLACCILLVLS